MKRLISAVLVGVLIFSAPCLAASDLETPFRPSDISTNLQGYWKLDNNPNDSSANGYHLTEVNTPTYTTDTYWKDGEYSGDLELGSSQYWTINDGSADNLELIATDFTVCWWQKLESTLATRRIASKGGQGQAGWAIYWGQPNSFYFYVGTTVAVHSVTEPVGEWIHFAAVFDNTAKKTYLYKNGNLASTVANAGSCVDNAYKFGVGCRTDALSAAYDGKLKDLAIWDTKLTPLQIKSLALGVDLAAYTYRPDNVGTAPTHWYKINELTGTRSDSGSTAIDLTVSTGTEIPVGGYTEGAANKSTGSTYFTASAADASFDLSTSDFTVAMWVKFGAKTTTYYLCGNHGAGYGTDGWGFQVYTDDGTKKMGMYLGATPTLYQSGAGDTWATDTWYHIAAVRTSGTLQFYRDGVVYGSSVSASVDATGSAVAFRVLSDGATNTNASTVCDVAIWNGTALTDAEIASLAAGLPIQQQGIVSYWKLDETSGTRVDSYGSNDLTDNNTVLYGTGKVSNAADFEFTNSEYLSITDGSQTDLDIQTDFTMLAWNKTESQGSIESISGKSGVAADGWYLVNSTTSGAKIIINGNYRATSPTAVGNGVWMHSVGGWDGANAFVSVDSVITTSAYTTAPADNATGFNIGSRGDGGHKFDGLVDEAIFAKRWFRPEEIKAVYNKGLNGKEATSTEKEPAGSDTNKTNWFFFF